ncbi:hypothetical protein E3N88_22471 [Mikania micrantha]|uniref:ARID domain-containing protein n=1 Tax=Mikania micrantha TaxID=192012 RepID=A0A5N6NCB1_9ASTR|nr:hypothetical protein E3N88_22471 [Mikania micrantha]
MVILLDLLAEINTNIINKAIVKEKFNKMVKWFNKYVIKKNDFWVPVMEGEEVDLYHLSMAVQLNGGKKSVTKNGFWSLIAAEMKMDSRKGFQLLLQYNEHLETMHWYYMNLKKMKQEQGSFAMEHGRSSTTKEMAEGTKLPFKKRRMIKTKAIEETEDRLLSRNFLLSYKKQLSTRSYRFKPYRSYNHGQVNQSEQLVPGGPNPLHN